MKRPGELQPREGVNQQSQTLHNLLATSLYFRTITIIGFDEQAQTIFRRLRVQGIRIGTQDLRIAAIALLHCSSGGRRSARETCSRCGRAWWSRWRRDGDL